MTQKNRQWSSMRDVWRALNEIHNRIEDEDIKLESAQARTRTLTAAIKAAAVMTENAKATGRLREGEATVPDLIVAPPEEYEAVIADLDTTTKR